MSLLTALHPPVGLDRRPATAYARAVARIPAAVVNARSRAHRWLRAGFRIDLTKES